ncbi:hypothetical protein Syun_010922 [Stephania yunnanensis]|uniref:DUF868 domain-containing protein n=1 Tax=Stephania yunnanensis TaxID=152371 RepID=A0AAP0JWL0_9MAGN
MPNYFSCFTSPKPNPPPQQQHPQQSPPLDTHTPLNPNTTTSIYCTDLARATLTWVRTGLARAAHIDLQFTHPSHQSHKSLHCLLLYKPFLFWRKRGSKRFYLENENSPNRVQVQLFWDLSKAKFFSSPEPQSGFYIAVAIDNETALLVGDRESEALAKITKIRTKKPNLKTAQNLIFRREHVFGRELFELKTALGGEVKGLSIESCEIDEEFVLGFNFDGKRLIQVRRLEWKFRGFEVIEFEGIRVHLSWDVYNWLFEESMDAPAMFCFRFERIEGCECEEIGQIGGLWREISGSEDEIVSGFKRKKRNYKSNVLFDTRSSSSSSISSSFSSGCNSSVLEWASSEESELQSGTTEFNLVVFAWKV